MKSLGELKYLVESVGLNIEEPFRQLHHFVKSPPFKTKPPGFQEFITYCESLSRGIQPNGENERTIQRTYMYVNLLKGGTGERAALATAWTEYPLARLD